MMNKVKISHFKYVNILMNIYTYINMHVEFYLNGIKLCELFHPCLLLPEPICAVSFCPGCLGFPLLPQQSGSDPLRGSHIYPATSQHEEQGLTILQGPCLLLLCREGCLLPPGSHCSPLEGPFLHKLPGPQAQAGWAGGCAWVCLHSPPSTKPFAHLSCSV